ncbi:hypothetical protein OAO18_07745 [Francisellaceae bacterium]|nr:hypothetical protein [Francisellaceae bacterium]
MSKFIPYFIFSIVSLSFAYAGNTNAVTEKEDQVYKHNPKLQQEIKKKDPAQAKYDDGTKTPASSESKKVTQSSQQ